jgi:SLIT-ROBO Rho GTPase activating protein
MQDQLASLEFRMESKLSLISEFQEFFKRRGEVEYEYARSLERLCEKFEKNTKQRNIRYTSGCVYRMKLLDISDMIC